MNGFEPPTSCRNMRSNQLSYITFIYIKQIPRFADKRLTDLVLQRYGLTINHSIISLRSPPTSVIPFGTCRLPKHHFTNMSKNSSLCVPGRPPKSIPGGGCPPVVWFDFGEVTASVQENLSRCLL